jgi:hypothetical protein
MLVDDEGVFLSQRDHSMFATIHPVIEGDSLILRHGATEVRTPLMPAGPRIAVRVWQSDCEAIRVDPAADTWLSSLLGFSARLVYMPDDFERPVHPNFAVGHDVVGFADGFPILCASTQSLDDLGRRIGGQLPMSRFRPNLIVAGAEAWDEDSWIRVRIGDEEYHGVKNCGRCNVTTIDQETGESQGQEPLRTLGTVRREGQAVIFGRYLIPSREGRVSVGDEVAVLKRA